MTVTLQSPYGVLRTPGGGAIKNGRRGVIERDGRVLFDRELQSLRVPSHWLEKPERRS